LEERFANIRKKRQIPDPWPKKEDFDRLRTLSTNPSPLFVYAATLCLYVEPNPVGRLKKWLEKSGKNAFQLNEQFNQMYKTVLDEIWSGTALDREEKRVLWEILRSIVLFATPLPARCLAALLVMEDYDVKALLPNLHAVLNIPSKPDNPVVILHESFRDFLLGQEGTGFDGFRVNESETHAMLALKCIDRMSKTDDGLERDMCKLQDPGKFRNEITETIITGRIPQELKYACLNWIYHLQHSGQHMHKCKAYEFLQEHFLHWIESLSLLGNLSDGVLSMRKLLHVVQVCL